MSSFSSKLILAVAAAGFSFSVLATDLMTPVGAWKTIDDETKKERVLIRITEANGVLTGKIEKNIDPTIAADAKCSECPKDDARYNQPTIGMAILKDVKKDGDMWSGGTILNAGNGKIYKVELRMADGGKKLAVKGKVGPFGKTQTWIRAE